MIGFVAQETGSTDDPDLDAGGDSARDRTDTVTGRLLSQRDSDRTTIDTWMGGDGSMVIAGVAIGVAAVFAWVVFSDSPLLAAAVMVVAVGYAVANRQGWV